MSRALFKKDSRQSAVVARALCLALPVEFHIRFSRLAYLNRLVTSGPVFVLAAIDVLANCRKSFFKLIVSDLMWLHSDRGSAYGMIVAGDDIRGVLDRICSDTRRFRKLLLRVKASTVSFMSIVALAEA